MQPGFRGRGLLGRFLYLLPPSPLGCRNLSSLVPFVGSLAGCPAPTLLRVLTQTKTA